MIAPTDYRLRCNKCVPARWLQLHGNDVSIVLDLENNNYIFTASCPICGGYINNIRPAFRPTRRN